MYDSAQPSEPLQKFAPEIDGGPSVPAAPNDDSEKLRVREGFGAVPEKPFPWTLILWPVHQMFAYFGCHRLFKK